MGLVTPLGVGLDHNWTRLTNGESGASAIEKFDVSDLPAKIAAQVPRGDGSNGTFNADDYVPAKDQRRIDEFIVYGISAAVEAVEDSGWKPDAEYDQERTGVMIGSGIGGLQTIYEGSTLLNEKGPRKVGPFFIPSALINLASGQISIRYGFKGPNHAVVTACSTGAHAIGDAARLIMWDDADVMVAGARKPRSAGSGSPDLQLAGHFRPDTTTFPKRGPDPMTRAGTASSWVRVPVLSCLRNTSMPRRAAPRSMPR